MVINAFITHKKAEKYNDCQDRFSINIDTKSIAVSDGMGETWQQKIWAQLLAQAFTDDINWSPTKESITGLSKLWKKKVCEFIETLKRENAKPNIIYRNERNLAEGKSAGATFVGIRLNGTSWDGFVLGDSCLITWDGDDATFFTSQSGEEFNSYPDYFDSDFRKDGKGTPKPIHIDHDNNLTLLLVSDPFSEFLLEKKKTGDIKQYILSLIDISNHEDYESLVTQWREEGMHNDDTTAIIIKPSNDISFSTLSIDDIDSLIKIEEAKRKAEEEAKRKAEEEAKRKAEEEAKQKAEEEAKQKAEEEAKQKAEEEAKKAADKAQKERLNNVVSQYQQNKKDTTTSPQKSSGVNETNKILQEGKIIVDAKNEEVTFEIFRDDIISEYNMLLNDKFSEGNWFNRHFSHFSKKDIAQKCQDAFEESLAIVFKKYKILKK